MILCWQYVNQHTTIPILGLGFHNKLAFKLVVFFLSRSLQTRQLTSQLTCEKPWKNHQFIIIHQLTPFSSSPSIFFFLTHILFRFLTFAFQKHVATAVSVSVGRRGPRCEARGSFNWKSLLARQSCSLKRPARRPTGMGGDTWWKGTAVAMLCHVEIYGKSMGNIYPSIVSMSCMLCIYLCYLCDLMMYLCVHDIYILSHMYIYIYHCGINPQTSPSCHRLTILWDHTVASWGKSRKNDYWLWYQWQKYVWRNHE